MRVCLIALVSLFASLAPDHAFADPPGWTSQAAAGVRLVGFARSSSTDVPREPEYALSNLTDAPLVVDIVGLWSLGNEAQRERLSVTSSRRITLAPRVRRTLAIEYAGRAINLGGGLTYHRFELVIAVGGARLAAVASTAYICRIPRRRPVIQSPRVTSGTARSTAWVHARPRGSKAPCCAPRRRLVADLAPPKGG